MFFAFQDSIFTSIMELFGATNLRSESELHNFIFEILALLLVNSDLTLVIYDKAHLTFD